MVVVTTTSKHIPVLHECHTLLTHYLQYLFQLGNCVEIGLPMLLLVIGVSQVFILIVSI